MEFVELLKTTLKLFSPGLVGGGIITILLLITGHWFPWQQWLGQPLDRLGAYAYGTVSIWLGFTIWRVCQNDLITPLGLACICLIGGLAVISAYRFDAYILTRARRRRQHLVQEHEQTERLETSSSP